MAETTEYLDKIEKLINSADKFNDMSFRLVLEGLVNKGGEDAEMLLARFITSQEVDLDTRLNVIRVVGYVQSRHFLIPLKKVIDSSEHLQLKKEAVISVSKYNDRRALNILNHALANIKNPLLQDTINNEISKIKRNNPVFALLPRFLEGENNPKNFGVTMGILKRILTPTDASIFASYLHCGKPFIENGAFEIICYCGDIDHQEIILRFYQERFEQTPCAKMPMCDDLLALTENLKFYFHKHPELIDQQLDNLGTQLFYVKDDRIREEYISIACRSQKEPAIHFVGKVFESEPSLQTAIIKQYHGNEAAMDLLFDKYHNGGRELRKPLIKSLLSTSRGIEYFQKQLDTLDPSERELVVDNMPYGGKHDLSAFFLTIFDSDHQGLKETLLVKARQNFEFSVKDILFDTGRINDFSFMEKEYLDTISQLFPISTIKRLYEDIVYEELTMNKIRKNLEIILKILPANLALQWRDKHLLAILFNKILTINNPDLSILFLSGVKIIKTFDPATLNTFNESLGLFLTHRQKKIGEAENAELRRARKNFKDIHLEMLRVDDDLKTLVRILSYRDVDFDQISNFVSQHGISIALRMNKFTELVEKRLMPGDGEEIRKWLNFFNNFPMLAFRLKDLILKKAQAKRGPEYAALFRFHKALPEEPPLKIVLRMTNRRATAVLREQCNEILPDITVDSETDLVDESDILICDSITIKEFVMKNMLPAKLFLLLEDVSEFESYKTYNPRPLMKPFSAYRISREILKEIYI